MELDDYARQQRQIRAAQPKVPSEQAHAQAMRVMLAAREQAEKDRSGCGHVVQNGVTFDLICKDCYKKGIR